MLKQNIYLPYCFFGSIPWRADHMKRYQNVFFSPQKGTTSTPVILYLAGQEFLHIKNSCGCAYRTSLLCIPVQINHRTVKIIFWQSQSNYGSQMNVSHSEADPNIELKGDGVVLLALAVFLPSVISFFFYPKKEGWASSRSTTVALQNVTWVILRKYSIQLVQISSKMTFECHAMSLACSYSYTATRRMWNMFEIFWGNCILCKEMP